MLKIKSTGIYLPERKLSAREAQARSEKALGRSLNAAAFDVASRFENTGETISEMGARALTMALDLARLKATDLDLILFGSSMPEQPIPCTAVLVQRKLGLGESGIPCFDVSATCTSFLSGLQIAQGFMASGQYRRIAMVCSEIATDGINYKEIEVASLIGDGAAAAILDYDPESGSKVLANLVKTFSAHSDLCEIRAGGSRYNVLTPPPQEDDYLFRMEGRGVYRAASKYLPGFLDELFGRAGMKMSQIDWVIPHQASPLALKHLSKKLGFPEGRMIDIIQTHGNQVSASLPTALHTYAQGPARRGDKILLLGTGAGLTLNASILVY